jgi:flagellar capping protein FliD
VHKHKNNLQRGDTKMGWRKRAWPGRGPYSYLPPWERPGWAYGGRGYGRGWGITDPRVCGRFPWLPRWWWADPAYAYQPPPPKAEEEIAALEDCKKTLADEKTSIEQEINDLETQIKELKTKLEQEKKQPTEK